MVYLHEEHESIRMFFIFCMYQCKILPDIITVLLNVSARCGMALSLHDSTLPLWCIRILLMVAVDTITVPLMFVRFTVNISCGG